MSDTDEVTLRKARHEAGDFRESEEHNLVVAIFLAADGGNVPLLRSRMRELQPSTLSRLKTTINTVLAEVRG